MVSLTDDLVLALDRGAFAESLGVSPDPWQAGLLRSTSDRVLMNVARQAGKSATAAIIALHRALYYPGSLVLILAPSERQAKETFSKVTEHYRKLGNTIPPDSLRKLGVRLPNGSRIEALPGSEKTIRGFSGVNLLILDEASRVEDSLYYAVRPMLAVSGGALMMLSTPYGKRGVFYEEWANGDGWERYQVPARECPRIPPDFLEKDRRTLPGYVFRQEYECSFEETDDQIFTHEMIERARADDIEEYRFERDTELWNTA